MKSYGIIKVYISISLIFRNRKQLNLFIEKLSERLQFYVPTNLPQTFESKAVKKGTET